MIYKDSIIIIPARLKSKRLKNKQLQEINGIPLIKRVVEEVKKMNLCDLNVIITNKKLNSGSDRCFDALQKIKNKKYKYIVDLQSDMLNIDKKIIDDILINLHNKNIDIITAVYKTKDEKQKQQQQSVKVAINYNKSDVIHKCLYFSRSNIPFSNKTAYIHIGIYGYSVKSLIKFANLEQSNLEKTEKLEQLRALENNMSIYTIITNKKPISIDTKDDLYYAEKFIK